MGRHRRTSEVDDYLYLRVLLKENLIPTHYILCTWWLHFMDRLRQYVIHPGAVAQILVMTNNIIPLAYTYAHIMLKKLLKFSAKLHTPAGKLHGSPQG